MASSPGGTDRSRRTRRFRVFAVTFGLFLAAGLIEVGLRVADVGYPQFMRSDELVGYRLAPDVAGWYTREGHAWVQTNHDGLRDVEHARAKPENTYRVVVLGDSYTEARQVEREQTFVATLDRELRPQLAARGLSLETINFGVEGYGTAQELLVLQHRALEYSPDLVLLAFFASNDLADNSKTLGGSSERPYFVLRGDELVLDTSFRSSWTHRLRMMSSAGPVVLLLQESRLAQVALVDASLAFKRLRAMVRGSTAGPAGPTAAQKVLAPPQDPRLEEAWRVTEAMLRAIRDRCEAAGARFALVSLSTPEQVHPDRAYRAEVARMLEVPDLFYPERRLSAIGERWGFPVLNLAPEMQVWAERHQQYLHGFGDELGTGHWNQLGHRLAGRRIAAWLRRDVIVDPRQEPVERQVAVARSRER